MKEDNKEREGALRACIRFDSSYGVEPNGIKGTAPLSGMSLGLLLHKCHHDVIRKKKTTKSSFVTGKLFFSSQLWKDNFRQSQRKMV